MPLNCSAGKPRISIVDDDSSMRQSLARLLRLAGFLPVKFASGDSFLKAQSGDPSACVLLDLRMPGLSGFDVKRQLDKSEPHLPVILLTANTNEAPCLKAKQEGFAACLSKSGDPSHLLSAIAQALQRGNSFTSAATSEVGMN
jgi:FixJ family two-component response regulator